jgi:hypothetical protein
MKIKIRFKKPKKPNLKKPTNVIKKLNNKRIKTPNLIRTTIIAIIVIALLFSAYSAYASNQKPKTTEETKPILDYRHQGFFDYTVYLKENTVYEGKEYLRPGEGNYFKNIIDHINASFTYTFTIEENSDIYTTYSIIAQIETDYWTKTYTLVPNTPINSTNKKSLTFTETFPINYEYYEAVVQAIDEETAITSQDPTLIIKSNVYTSATTNEGKYTNPIRSITDSISFSLNEKIIEVTDTTSGSSTGTITETQTIQHPEVIQETNRWTNIAYLFLTLIILVLIITKSDAPKLSKTEKTVQKIKKKYEEWIVDVTELPKRPIGSEIVSMKTFEDLMKISEELGKPVIHHESNPAHTFLILDQDIQYQYKLTDEDKKTQKTIKCPDCKTKIELEGKTGETVKIECPNCGKKGTTKI